MEANSYWEDKRKETLKVIEQRELLGKKFKIYGTLENPLFLAKDVAEWIEHSNVSKMVSSLDEEEKQIHKLSTLTNGYSATFLTEDGMYEVLMQSRKPIAKQFKKEVKKILKQLRLTGGAVTNEENFIKNYFPSFSDEVKEAMVLDLRKQNAINKEKIESLQLTNKQQEQIIGELKPKADYTDKILKNKGLVPITPIAKDYGMSAQEMNNLLHKLGVQYKKGEQWFLYTKYQRNGYTHSDTIDIVRSDGRADIVMNTKWTQKGRLFIYDLLKEEGILPLIEQGCK